MWGRSSCRKLIWRRTQKRVELELKRGETLLQEMGFHRDKLIPVGHPDCGDASNFEFLNFIKYLLVLSNISIQ